MQRWRSTRGSRRTRFSRWTGVAWKWKGNVMVYSIFNRDSVTFNGLLECSTHRGAAKIGAMSRMPKNYTPALPAEGPRLYHILGL